MKTLSVDIETFSSIELKRSGVYRYAEALDFEILLFGYAVDNGEIQVVDIANGETVPEEVVAALTDESVIKWAFNAQFERICLSKWLGLKNYLNPTSWRCSMVWSAYMGMPLSLEAIGSVLNFEKQKLSEGKDLIRYFCKPCKPTKANGGRIRNLSSHAPDKWELFKKYNQRDVEVEMAIQQKLKNFPVSEAIWKEYQLDQKINDRGVKLDMTFVDSAIKTDNRSKEVLTSAMKKLTKLDNPNSVTQMKSWLIENGVKVDTLEKKAVKELLTIALEPICEVLKLRQQLSKSSVKKYTAMKNVICDDGKAHGMFQFYGANRTGRFAGKLIQLQNLPQNHLPDLKQARDLVRSGNFTALEMLYDSVPEVLSELIRTAFVPKEDCEFIVADFSAIEARVIAWFAGETWRNEVFASHGKIYEASAAQMFKIPIEEITKGSPLRQKGKIAELALGYGGSVGALKAMGALENLSEDELQPLVTAWRSANPNIVKLWWDVDRAAIKAVKGKTFTETHGIEFSYKSAMLFITLPSGRQLSYVKPRIGENKFGSSCVTYGGVGTTKKWERIESYGPKFVENIVQAISRDILCFAMQNLRQYPIVMHVHDEIVIENQGNISVKEICEKMSQTPPWAEGLLLTADGYKTEFYKKD